MAEFPGQWFDAQQQQFQPQVPQQQLQVPQQQFQLQVPQQQFQPQGVQQQFPQQQQSTYAFNYQAAAAYQGENQVMAPPLPQQQQPVVAQQAQLQQPSSSTPGSTTPAVRPSPKSTARAASQWQATAARQRPRLPGLSGGEGAKAG
jgi:hypothetical protein